MEAIIYLGEINGRMKDYFDCYRMIDENLLSPKLLKIAINETFVERQTTIEIILDELKKTQQSRWTAFVRKENISNLKIEQVIDTINLYLTSNDVIALK